MTGCLSTEFEQEKSGRKIRVDLIFAAHLSCLALISRIIST